MKQQTSGLPISYLMKQPESREILLCHLSPLGLTAESLESNSGNLQAMVEINMGGGLPYTIAVRLLNELNDLKIPYPSSIETGDE